MRFTKMHGLGNDYVYVDTITQKFDEAVAWSEIAQAVSKRHFGVGSDGLILICPSERADFRMRIFNPDGSEAEMCGNGVRCFAKYVFEHGLADSQRLRIETGGGIVVTELHVEGGRVKAVRVDMGPPRVRAKEVPMSWEPADEPAIEVPLEVGDGQIAVTAVSMGNPHCVVFVEDAESYPVNEVGPQLEHHPVFPQRTNVEFASVVDEGVIRMRVWERGAGVTMACGTGACATAVAAAMTDRAGRRVTVVLDGGELEIEWAEDGHVYMTGPAAEVYSGQLSPEFLESLGKASTGA